jgi:hypothetical protein
MVSVSSPRNLGFAVLLAVASACNSSGSDGDEPDGNEVVDSAVSTPEATPDAGIDAAAPNVDTPDAEARDAEVLDADAVDGGSCVGVLEGHEEGRTAFEAELVEAGETCKSEEQVRTCSNGRWSEWSGEFEALTCEVKGQRSCGPIAHDEETEQVRYEQAEVPFGSQCVGESQIGECSDGVLEFDGKFTFEKCTVAKPADCQGGVHGDVRTRERFESAVVPAGQACKAETQVSTCYNGAWSEYDGKFTSETCGAAPADCVGGKHGAVLTRDRFEQAIVPFGHECKVEQQKSTCVNGSFSEYTGSFQAEKCVVADPRDCEGGFKHGEQRTRTYFKTASVPYGEECESQLQTSTCNDGTWGEFVGDFAFAECAPRPPASCGPAQHGGSIRRVRFKYSFVHPGTKCEEEEQTNTCDNGHWQGWTGTFAAETCEVIGTCIDRDTDERIEPGAYQTRTMYERAFPADECKAEQQQRKCEGTTDPRLGAPGEFGKWSGSYKSEGCAPLPWDAPQAPFACRTANNGFAICREWTALSQEEQDKMLCSGPPGDKRACPTGGSVVGKCEEKLESGAIKTTYYYVGWYENRAKASCVAPAVWTDL